MNQPVTPPDPAITAAENALVVQTKGKIIDDFPGRSGYGSKGKAIVLRTNYFSLTTAFEANMNEVPLYRYEVEIKEFKDISKPKRRRVFDSIVAHAAFANLRWATDYSSIIVTTEKLDLEKMMAGKVMVELTIPPENGAVGPSSEGDQPPEFVKAARARNTFHFRLHEKESFNPRAMVEYLKSTSAGAMYQGRADLIQLLNIIITKAPNEAAQVKDVGKNFYPFGTHPGMESYDLGQGLEALRGYFSSVRPAIGRLLVNINVTSGAFYKSMYLLDLVREVGSGNDQAESFIRMLKVEVRYTKDGQKEMFMKKAKTIVGFAKPHKKIHVKRFGNAHEVRISIEDRASPNTKSQEMTVAEYFKKNHGITLKRPELPLLNVGTRDAPQYLPMELCWVNPGQAYRRLLSGNQTSEMLKFAARFPNLNAMSIAGVADAPGNGLRLLRLAATGATPQNESVGPFGFRVGIDMISVPGRILQAPSVNYGKKSVTPRNGSWNLAGTKFGKPGKFNRWQVLVINLSGRNTLRGPVESTVGKLGTALMGYGINMGERVPTMQIELDRLTMMNRPKNDAVLKGAFERAEGKRVDMLFIIIPDVDRWLYARIKFFGDVVHGVGTICSVGSKLEKENGQDMYLGNLALKFNLKGGGISHSVANTVTAPIDANTMVVGIDVTHPSPDSAEDAPSVSCVVASVDSQMFQWPGSIRTQKGRQEMVEPLEEMFNERLDLWVRKNQKLPTKVVVYRDGVSEGQYQTVLREELPAFENVFEKRYGKKDRWPKMAIIIVGKRHHTRFYPTRVEDADYNPQRDKGSWNPLPGTIVDRGIVGKVIREFYLQAHQGLQGTARPAHYVVIKDDISFTADALEQFTHHLCYLFNRATKAVSICPPAYYADLLCERGRAYLFNTLSENTSSDSSVTGDAPEGISGVHHRLRDTTWYV